MMVFIVVESIMIAGVTLYQFNNQNSEYHEGRLERKENNLLTDLKYEIDKNDSHCFKDSPFALLIHGTQKKGYFKNLK